MPIALIQPTDIVFQAVCDPAAPSQPDLAGVVTLSLAAGATVGLGAAAYRVFGSRGQSETVIVPEGAQAVFDPSFNSGQDVLILGGDFGDYCFQLLGSTVRATSANGTAIDVPLGGAGLRFGFDDSFQRASFDPATGELSFHQLSGIPPAVPEIDPAAVSRIVLSPNGETSVGLGAFTVFGRPAGEETLTLGAGALVTLDPSFNQGGDTIVMPGASGDFERTRDGSTLVFDDGEGTVLRLPFGLESTFVTFDNGRFQVFFDQDDDEVEFQRVITPTADMGDLMPVEALIL
ncbi:MAG: hypothetical protein V2J26_10750 [Pacificimonas sp.]|jgi:hypothetical protein|nr:hypothetical protein [Pacificimonas sp.]